LDARHAAVIGRGAVTVRVRGRSEHIETGEELPLDRISELADELAAGVVGRKPAASPENESGDEPGVGPKTRPAAGQGEGSPLLAAVRTHEEAFRAARDAGHPEGM